MGRTDPTCLLNYQQNFPRSSPRKTFYERIMAGPKISDLLVKVRQ